MRPISPYLFRNLLQEYEVNEHKWFLSEEEGYDVGISFAVANFIKKGHAQRFAENYDQHEGEIERFILERNVEENFILTGDLVHALLRD